MYKLKLVLPFYLFYFGTVFSKPEVPIVTFEKVQTGLQECSIILLDVRNKEELKIDGMIPGAINLPNNLIKNGVLDLSKDEFNPKLGFSKESLRTQNLVVICQNEECGRNAALVLQNHEFRSSLYAGGFEDWKERGGEVIDYDEEHENHCEEKAKLGKPKEITVHVGDPDNTDPEELLEILKSIASRLEEEEEEE